MQSYFDTINLPLYTADFQYFRLPREKWELMLTRLGQMGLDTVTIALPWGFHEIEQSSFDIQGTTNARRNVTGLLELCTALDFYCLLQLGLYHYGRGLLRDGLPSWLPAVEDDVEANLRAPAKSWYRFLSETLSKHQWPHGPVIALQIDSQAGLANQPTYSQELTEIKWPIWLRKQYRGIEALNAAYGASYRSVSEVPFPHSWGSENERLEEDARSFLAEIQDDSLAGYDSVLKEAGWLIPILDLAGPDLPDPSARDWSALTDQPTFVPLDDNETLLNLPSPIQVEPDPTDIGIGPSWAGGAPIRVDGSLTPKFWDLRRHIWPQLYSESKLEDQIITMTFEGGGLVTGSHDTKLKLDLEAGAKPVAYRLALDGCLEIEDRLRVFRGKLSGSYLAQDNVSQTDLVLYLDDPAQAVPGYAPAYLGKLLRSQAQTLNRCSQSARQLAQSLLLDEPAPALPKTRTKPSSYTLAEARRGLKEADAALRKAMRSVGGLEMGFGTILGRDEPSAPTVAATPISINPEIFEGRAREILLETGKVCRQISPQLSAVAQDLQQRLAAPAGFTVAQYQQGYQAAIDVAQDSRQPLLHMITLLRTEIAAEALPLVIWRVHDQIQAITESLRWGVLRR